VRCDILPAVLAPGLGLLSVVNNVGWALNDIPVEYVNLVDAVLDKRPYISETVARILLRCNASLLNGTVDVSATVPTLPPSITAGWCWPSVILSGSNVLQFNSPGLPATVDADVTFEIVSSTPAASESASIINVTKKRRLMRAPPVRLPNRAVAMQVDHSTRGLLVGGSQFLGFGWCVSTWGFCYVQL
jgi:hypothetical protein